MRPININVAEAIIEPFWDRNFTPIRSWDIDGVIKPKTEGAWWDNVPKSHYIDNDGYEILIDETTGAYIKETWSGVIFGWNSACGEKPVIAMSKNFDINCARYNRLVLSAMIPKGAVLILYALTNEGEKHRTFTSEDVKKGEYSLDITNGDCLKRVKIEMYAPLNSTMSGHLQFLMLQNSVLEEEYTESLKCENEDWVPWLKSEDYNPQFKPLYGILADDETIKKLRETLDIKEMLEAARNAREPEPSVSDFVNAGTDTRFPRVRDYNKDLSIAIDIAFAGIIGRDKELLRKGARYALSIASCTYWHEGFICRTPGFLFDHKAFAPSIYCRIVATVMDLAGEMFTNAGIQFLLRRLGEEGIASINWVIWKYSVPPEDIFAINQLVWFSWGRVPAYTVLEQYWHKTKPYTDLAYQEICESINRIILPDGGYDEGPTYFTSVSRMAGEAIYWYARSRKMDFQSIIPDAFLKTKDFAECFLSFDKGYGLMPVSDAACDVFSPEKFVLLAMLMPESHWVTLFRNSWEIYKGKISDVQTLLLEKSVPKEFNEYQSFISMENTGAVSSVRRLDGEIIKIFQCGGNPNSNHAHEDKGSFIVQFAGETIAADPGIGKYDDNIGSSLGGVRWHNMLIPVVGGGSSPDATLSCDIKPIASGDENFFKSFMELTKSWSGAYKKWTREIFSPKSDSIIITDDYELVKGSGVIFNLVTLLDVHLKDGEIVIEGRRTSTVIKIADNCTARVEKMPEFTGKQYNRIIIECGKKQGRLVTEMFFSL